jgi:DNA-binding NtrC family response regulator
MARVTVINDSSQFLDLMRELLAELGHDMVGLEAVKTSIEEIVASRPELLVVDLRLEDKRQEVSGWELVILARSHRQLLGVPIILCTADLWELTKRADDLEQIANVHVRTMPFTLDDMSGLITRLLRPQLEVVAD